MSPKLESGWWRCGRGFQRGFGEAVGAGFEVVGNGFADGFDAALGAELFGVLDEGVAVVSAERCPLSTGDRVVRAAALVFCLGGQVAVGFAVAAHYAASRAECGPVGLAAGAFGLGFGEHGGSLHERPAGRVGRNGIPHAGYARHWADQRVGAVSSVTSSGVSQGS